MGHITIERRAWLAQRPAPALSPQPLTRYTMNDMLIRALIGLLFAGVLWAQARNAAGAPLKQRAFRLAMAAALCLAGYSAAVGLGVGVGPIQIVLMVAGVALMIGALLSLALSLSGKEMAGRNDQFRELVRRERQQIEQRMQERERRREGRN